MVLRIRDGDGEKRMLSMETSKKPGGRAEKSLDFLRGAVKKSLRR